VAQASVLDLAILVEKSLLRRAGEGRFELHELVRQFAAEKLIESGQEQAAQARHADFYFSFLGEQIPDFNGPNPQETTAVVRQAMDNFRAAWHWAAAHHQITLLEQVMDGFGQFLMLTSSGREGEEVFENALNILQQTGPDGLESLAVQSRLASRLAWFQIGLGKHQPATENATRAVALADRGQDGSSRAYGLSILGWTLQTQGEYGEAETALLEAVALFNETGNPLQASAALIRLGSVYWRKRDFEKTLEYYQQSLDLAQRLQNKRGNNRAYGGIGVVYLFLEKYDEALEWLDKALALDRELGNSFGVARHLGNMGAIYYAVGDYPQALLCYQEAVKIEKENEHLATLAVWLGSIGNVYKEIGEQDLALDYYDQAITLEKELEDRFNLCEALLGKGEVYLQRGEYGRAKALIEQGRRLADEVQRKETQFDGRLLEARLLAKTGYPKEARHHLKTMLANLDEEEKSGNLAQLYYELWRIENEAEYAHQALAAYQAALSRAPRGKYRQRIEELTSFLSGRRNVNKRS
jgi:tetratricopeptide (TPR) repeat protein